MRKAVKVFVVVVVESVLCSGRALSGRPNAELAGRGDY